MTWDAKEKAQIGEEVFLEKFVSRETGLTIVNVKVDTPIVYGYFCLGTEACDDDGLPHTLEHLIFLGSESYPYKGILDDIANRCLARGTNAWTDVDHTAYTLETAGSEGFLTMLPIYLDHIFFPLLTNAGFVTEVHHITGKGLDAGVVYSEMQARENTASSRAHRLLLRCLYGPPEVSSLSAETGGILANLRQLTNDKVRQYHAKYYRPENMCIIVIGNIETTELLTTLEEVEAKIRRKREESGWLRNSFQKPWKGPIPPMPELDKNIFPVNFPADDESSGSLYLGWRGPFWSELEIIAAIEVLHSYLTGGASSPLQAALVDCEEPLCSAIHYSLLENKETAHIFVAEDTAPETFGDVLYHYDKVIESLCQPGAIDYSRLEALIHRAKVQFLASVEESPEDLAFPILINFLYRSEDEENCSLIDTFNVVERLEWLCHQQETFWIDILKKYFVRMDDKTVVVESTPSLAESEHLREEEEKRIDSRSLSLSTEDLESFGRTLEEANEQNSRKPPLELISSVPIPNPKNIRLISISTYRDGLQYASDMNESFDSYCQQLWLENANSSLSMPFLLHIDHVHSSFIDVRAVLNTAKVAPNLRAYCVLFVASILETCVKGVDSNIIPYQQVVDELMKESIFAESSIGFGGGHSFYDCGEFPQALVLELKFESCKYSAAVHWLYRLLFETVFPAERLKSIASKLQKNISRKRRNGGAVSRCVACCLNFDLKKSNLANASSLYQYHFLQASIRIVCNDEKTRVLDQLERDPELVVRDMEAFRQYITQPEHLSFHLAADLKVLHKDNASVILRDEWLKHFGCLNTIRSENIGVAKKDSVLFTAETKLGSSCQEQETIIVRLQAVDSSFMILTTPCLNTFTHPDFPALTVLFEYLTMLEGPLWKGIRGMGYAYAYDMRCDPEEGLLYLVLQRSSQFCLSYQAVKEIFGEFVQGTRRIEAHGLEAAKAGVIYSIIEREKTVNDKAEESFINWNIRRIENPKDFSRIILSAVAKVDEAKIQQLMKQYLSNLFENSKIVVVTNPLYITEIENLLQKGHRKTVILENLDDFFSTLCEDHN
eukprot:jgi/Galph1/3911/GphlegSOOS_G2559.1